MMLEKRPFESLRKWPMKKPQQQAQPTFTLVFAKKRRGGHQPSFRAPGMCL